MGESDAKAAVGFLMLIIIILGTILLYAIPSIITTWKLYKKAGQPGWAAIVPVYHSVIMAKIARKPLWLGITVGVLQVIGYGFRNGSSATAINSIFTLAWIGFGLYLLNCFIKVYDRGLGFWFFYIFFPIVTMFTVKNANYKGFVAGSPTAPGQPQMPQPPQPPQAPQAPMPPAAPLPPMMPPATTPPAAPVPPQPPNNNPIQYN